MPSMFEDFALPADITARCYITHPGTKLRLRTTAAEGEEVRECWIEVYGYHSKPAQDWRYQREETLRRLGREFSPEEAEDNLAEMLAALTTQWQLVAPNGKLIAVDCNFAHAKKLYQSAEHRWMRQQVIDCLGELGNFLPREWIN